MAPGNPEKRMISGALFAVPAVVCIFAGVIPVGSAVLVLSTLALSEFYTAMKVRKWLKGIGYFWNVVLIVLFFDTSHPSIFWIPLVSLAFFHFFGHFIGNSGNYRDSLKYQSGALLTGFLWISQTLALSLWIRSLSQGAWWLFLSIAATAFCDTGAYLFGKLFGRHKLAPNLSAGKTIEGLVGGILMSVGIVLFLGRYVGLSWRNRLMLGAFLTPAAVLGDLLESYWKRKLEIKDSGTLVAGHGGLLDRLDSHFIAIPTLFLYLTLHR